MNQLLTRLSCLACCLLSAAPCLAQAPVAFELRDGDRVVFLGDALLEREQYYGYIELALTTRFPERHVTFRNLGWSADTPAGDSRCGLSLLQAGLEPPEEGWKQLQEQIRQVRPTVVVLGYGMASSFAGEKGLPQLRTDLNRLLDTIVDLAGTTKVRFVVLSPIPHLPRPAPLPAPTAHNHQLAQYTQALRELAQQRGAVFISLFDALKDQDPRVPLSENGIHLTAAGYQAAARIIEKGLGWPAGGWSEQPQAERLRQVILKKNELFFHRSRPANMAYIFGFRKREQGQNAVEMPQFEPLIKAEEKKIALLRSLKLVALPPEPPARTRSAAAKFTPQPRPQFEVGEGLEVTLWAENPLLHKPIQINFDPQGRLWVASSEVYPQIEPGQTANDQILILEDTTGAGRADQMTVFADGLLIPTGLEPGDGGVYVAQSTELLHYKDTNGDGKADVRRVVLSGFGTEDTHHNLHTLRWGPDGRLYMNQSIYTRTDTETPHGVIRLKSGGILRLRPDPLHLEVLFRGWVNAWGHQFDAFGQSFVTDGAGSGGINYGVPGAMYVTYARARRILDSVSPGSYPKFCSLEIVHSKHFPDDWQGDLITCDFRANRVVRFRIEENGAGYVTREMPDLLRTKEISFRPIDVKLGPDGALYIADWSNPIINHGEVDFRDPRRDREHGRIWRVTCKGRPLNMRPQLVSAANRALCDALVSPNSYESTQARRVLTERGRAVLPDLQTWQARQSTEPALLQALWLKQSLDEVDAALIKRLLYARDGRVRAAAVRVLAEWIERVPQASELLAARVTDDHPRVRLETVRALARIPTAAAADLALRVLEKPMDRFVDYALWLTLNDLAEPWLAALDSRALPVAGREHALEFGLRAVDPEQAGQALAKLLQQHPLTRAGRGPWIELIGAAGGPTELGSLFEQVLRNRFEEPALLRALTALDEAARLRHLKPEGDLYALKPLLESGSDTQRVAAIRLAGRWQLGQLLPQLVELATNKKIAAPIRLATFDALREFRGAAALAGLRTVVRDETEAASIRQQALLAWTRVDPPSALPLVHALLQKHTAEPEASAFWRALLAQTGMSPRLARTLRHDPIPAPAAAIGLRVARESGDRQRDLIQVLARLAGVPAPKEYTPAEIQRVATLARLVGDPARGELVYRRAELRCVACHALGGAGGKVGPDLTSIGSSAPIDYLAEALYMPNNKIKEGFHSVVLATKDGRSHTGILVRETAREVVLRDANDKEIAVPKNSIEERGQGSSLMPSGLVDTLFEGERHDLLRFLSELGKPGPFDAAKNQAPRLWRVLTLGAADAAGVARAQQGDDRLTGWSPLPATVQGALLKQEVQAVAQTSRVTAPVVFAATRFEVAKAGRIHFRLETAASLALWIDGKPVTAAPEIQLDLAPGVHTLVLKLDRGRMPEGLVVRSADVAFRAD